MLPLELQGFTIGLQCKSMWYLPLFVASWLLVGKCNIWILVGKFLMDLLGFWSDAIQSCHHYFNGVVYCVWSILAHANFFIYMLCLFLLFTQRNISRHLVYFFSAWNFKLTIISLFINVALDLYYQTKNYTKVKKNVCAPKCSLF
jgi:hypothetical protein